MEVCGGALSGVVSSPRLSVHSIPHTHAILIDSLTLPCSFHDLFPFAFLHACIYPYLPSSSCACMNNDGYLPLFLHLNSYFLLFFASDHTPKKQHHPYEGREQKPTLASHYLGFSPHYETDIIPPPLPPPPPPPHRRLSLLPPTSYFPTFFTYSNTFRCRHRTSVHITHTTRNPPIEPQYPHRPALVPHSWPVSIWQVNRPSSLRVLSPLSSYTYDYIRSVHLPRAESVRDGRCTHARNPWIVRSLPSKVHTTPHQGMLPRETC